MLNSCSLQSLYCLQANKSTNPFNQTVYQFLKYQAVPVPEFAEECSWVEPLFVQDKIVENWKKLLSYNLLCEVSNLLDSHIDRIVRNFEGHPWNQNSQYLRSLIAINHALAKMPIPEVGPMLLESGAALIELHEYHPWLSLPYSPEHFEFGIFLCMLALLSCREDLEQTVLKLAQWQINTLDANGKPFTSLFVREKNGKSLQQLCLSYLFFRSVAALKPETPFAIIAQSTLKDIEGYLGKTTEEIDPLWPLIERWLERYDIVSKGPLSLSEHVYDPSTALVGYRSTQQHVICTLHGGYTGLGTLRYGDVEILTYGPQHLPLGECQAFGIEGNSISDQGIRRSVIEWKGHSFTIKGCTRVVDQPIRLSTEQKFGGIWMEVVQEFKKPHFFLKTNFLGLDGWDSIVFTFFIRAARCKVESRYFLPGTLGQYEGEVQTILFEGVKNFLELKSFSSKGKMQVIPLGGNEDFWGANFLIAYYLNSDQSLYQWHIGPP